MVRTPNDPTTAPVIMNVLQSILPANTALAAASASGTGVELVYIEDKYSMLLAMSQIYPSAVHIQRGNEKRGRNSRSTYDGTTVIEVNYFTRWDEQDSSIDALWREIVGDLQLMRSNAESNDSLQYGGSITTISIANITMGVYDKQFDKTFPNLALVYASMILTYNILPYSV